MKKPWTLGVIVLVAAAGCDDTGGSPAADAGRGTDMGVLTDTGVDLGSPGDTGVDAGGGADAAGGGVSEVNYAGTRYPLDGFNTAGLPGTSVGFSLNGGGTGSVPYYQFSLTLSGIPVPGVTYDCEGGTVSGSLGWIITGVGSWGTNFDGAVSSCAITFTQVPGAIGERFVGTFSGTLSSTTANNPAVMITGIIDEPRDF